MYIDTTKKFFCSLKAIEVEGLCIINKYPLFVVVVVVVVRIIIILIH